MTLRSDKVEKKLFCRFTLDLPELCLDISSSQVWAVGVVFIGHTRSSLFDAPFQQTPSPLILTHPLTTSIHHNLWMH